MKLLHLIPSCLLLYCLTLMASPAFAADHLAALDQRLSEGDRLLAAGKPVEAIRTWRSIWDLDAVDVAGLGKQLSTVDKFIEAYESMGQEGLEVAADYLEVIAGMSVEERQPAQYVRLGDVLWKGGRKAEAAQAYQRALDLQPARADAAQLKERIVSAPAVASRKRDLIGTQVFAPRAVPAECIDPPPSRLYPLNGGRSLCVTFNEFGNEPGYWTPRQSLGGAPNLTIQVEGTTAEPRGKDSLPITVYLNDGKTWRRVLDVRGYGFRFVRSGGRDLPDLEIHWDPLEKAADDVVRVLGEKRRQQRTVFAWNGKRYGNVELALAQRLNAKALALQGKKDYKGALAVWQEALRQAMSPGSALPVDAEILNNYGFALLRHSQGEAEIFLGLTLQVDPARWQAHLNLGDLLWDQGHYDRAIESYRSVLRLNPSYRRAGTLQERITLKEQAIAELREDAAPVIEAREQNYLPCEGAFFVSAAEYARKSGLDTARIAAALNLEARDLDDGDAFETSGFSSDRYRSHCTSFTLRVVEIVGFSTTRGRFIAVLYWGAAPGGTDSQWRLALLRRGNYEIEKVIPLYESAANPVEETSFVSTDLSIDSGRLIATVTGSERGVPPQVRQLIVQPAADGSFETISSKSWEEEE
ncbi:hypothetical protein GPEL0_01r2028 [Geoanaerobacter pelophilus]|uniref:Tetratricopeptide repeat protein n=1 Tax=Geoanaerobacter pelophilus TaxID=60036 RepID=A0ABQ0MHN9_9BACT|nr:tetratricopeptide repeat protein [Geoanaerobacter pelophilus]GAW66594.1 hypothetical protein GPEL0_01r2028 [Geoanaerobacter pelophilus]